MERRRRQERGDGVRVSRRRFGKHRPRLCPALLAPLNASTQPGTRPKALKAALDLTVAPDGYHDDMLLCLGLNGQASTVDDALAAGPRLVQGTLALLEANADVMCPLLAPHWPELVTSGRLRRCLEQGDVASFGNGGET